VKPATTAMAHAGFLSLRCARGKDGHQMDLPREETRGVAREGVPPTEQGAPGSSAPAAPYRTTHLLALDHLASDLRAACHDGTVLTWAQITQCTLAAAQHASTSSPMVGHMLQRRMVLNHDLYQAFMARQHGRPWKTFDGTTLVMAVDDLIAAEHNQPQLEIQDRSPGRTTTTRQGCSRSRQNAATTGVRQRAAAIAPPPMSRERAHDGRTPSGVDGVPIRLP